MLMLDALLLIYLLITFSLFEKIVSSSIFVQWPTFLGLHLFLIVAYGEICSNEQPTFSFGYDTDTSL